MRDKIACSQFIVALSDGNIKQILQLEGLTSLRLAVERAMAIKIMRENSFGRKVYSEQAGVKNFSFSNGRNFSEERNKVFEKRNKREANYKGSKSYVERYKFLRKEKECWQCGKQGHFRSECPTLLESQKGN
ncbi:hypothetical protein P5V15_007158 [Pogonomyrmex californicus]